MQDSKGNVLLLGMFYSKGFEPSRGQGFRDGIRCQAVENVGYSVWSLDDKHSATGSEVIEGKHCQTNFANARRMAMALRRSWPQILFDHIILDYFFSPVRKHYVLSIHCSFFV